MKSRSDFDKGGAYAIAPDAAAMGLSGGFKDYTLLDRAARTFEWNALGKTCQQKIYVNPDPYYPYRAVNPSSAWFKGIWNWDSAFIMMATRRWDPELARDQMRLWMHIQPENGMYPDGWTEGDGIQFPPSVCNSKPPVFAWAMWQLHKTAPDKEFLGGATVPEKARTYDEQNVVELADGTLRTWIRTTPNPGIMESVSKDGGRT